MVVLWFSENVSGKPTKGSFREAIMVAGEEDGVFNDSDYSYFTAEG
jgi:hypothetical protein